MTKTYSLKRVKKITSYAGHSRFLAECADEPVGYLARVQVEDIPSPYAYSPSKQILQWGDKKVVIFETSHRTYEVFEVPAQLLRFKTDDEATDWHIRFS